MIANSLEITGGGVGLFLTYAPGLQNLQFKTPVGFYYFALILLAISIAIAIWLENSRFGAQLVAIRENEDAAEALGIDTLRRKCQAIMIMGAMGVRLELSIPRNISISTRRSPTVCTCPSKCCLSPLSAAWEPCSAR